MYRNSFWHQMFSLDRLKLFLFCFLVLLMFGCREYHLYQYKPSTVDVLGGTLVVALEGTYGQNYEKDGEKYADFGAPYSLKFMLSMPYEYDLVELQIKDIEVFGETTKRKIPLPNTGSKKVKDPRKRTNPDAPSRTVIASIGGLDFKGLSYEAYSLTAKIIVIGNENSIREESISLKLDTNYQKERRSDWFDKKMSI